MNSRIFQTPPCPRGGRASFYSLRLKRLVDICAAAFGLLLLSPLFGLLVLLVRWKLGAPVFFSQKRPGLHGKPFLLLKFRTMTDARDADGVLLPNEKRITPLGSIIRKCSLDELPQLVNVLKGDMSLIGPRPLPMRYLELYSPEQMRRHDVRPGITGWAQVNGRNTIPWTQRFQLDVWYVDNIALLTDVRIVLKTLFRVLFRKDVDAGQGKVGGIGFDGTN